MAPQTDGAQSRGLAERLRQSMANATLAEVGTVTASFGVAQYRPQESVEDWVNRADEALYTAKRGGKNQVAAA